MGLAQVAPSLSSPAASLWGWQALLTALALFPQKEDRLGEAWWVLLPPVRPDGWVWLASGLTGVCSVTQLVLGFEEHPWELF